MDGTLYDMKDLALSSFNLSVSYLVERKNYPKEEAVKLLDENNIYPYYSESAKSTTQLFVSLGFDVVDWNDFRSQRFPYQQIIKDNATNNNVLSKYSELTNIVLLTNNTKTNVDHVLNHIGIKHDAFSGIYLNSKKNSLSKKDLMSEIIREYNVEASHVLSIGDRYNVDGVPILELGGKAIIIKNPKGLEKVLVDYPNFVDNDYYKYYEK